jgi:hypothetical protein
MESWMHVTAKVVLILLSSSVLLRSLVRRYPKPSAFLSSSPHTSSRTLFRRSDGLGHGRVLALDAGLEEGGVAEDEDRAGADDPEHGRERRGPPERGDAEDEEARVQVLLRNGVLADLRRIRGCGASQKRVGSRREENTDRSG